MRPQEGKCSVHVAGFDSLATALYSDHGTPLTRTRPLRASIRAAHGSITMADQAEQQDSGTLSDLDVNTGGAEIAKLGLLGDIGPDEGEAEDAGEEQGFEDAGQEPDFEEQDDFEDDAADEDFDGDDDFEDEGDAEDEGDEEGQDEAEGSDEAPTYMVKVQGEEIEVTLDEALSGYQRTADYTRKTTELADKRKALLSEAEELSGLQAAYVEKLDIVEQALSSAVPENVDWAQVKKDNPGNYAEIREQYDANKAKLDAIRAEKQQAVEQATELRKRHMDQVAEVEREKLFAAVPEWSDPDTYSEEAEAMLSAITTYGFAPKDLDDVRDHRVYLMLRDAMQWQKHQENSVEAKKTARKTRRKGKTLEPGRPDRSSRKSKKSSKSKKAAMQRLKKSGRIDDAAEAMKGLFS